MIYKIEFDFYAFKIEGLFQRTERLFCLECPEK